MRTLILTLLLMFVDYAYSQPVTSGVESFFKSGKEIANLQLKADKGDSEAAYGLFIYHSFYSRDNKLSEKWLKIAATLKHAQAQRALALSIKNDNYSPKPFGETAPEAVLNLLEQSAQTEGSACWELASAYANGYFGKKDLTKARFYFLRGSNLNDRNSWSELSNYYYKGLGGPTDYVKAYYWISLEARSVDPRSVSGHETWTKREEIATQLSLSELEKLWKRIDSFIEQVNLKKVILASQPFLSGAINPTLEKEGRRLSKEKEDKHRSDLKEEKR